MFKSTNNTEMMQIYSLNELTWKIVFFYSSVKGKMEPDYGNISTSTYKQTDPHNELITKASFSRLLQQQWSKINLINLY